LRPLASLVAFQHGFYNTTINQDTTMISHAKYIAKSLAGRRDTTEDFPAPHARYVDASILLKTWLSKRQSIAYGSKAHGGGRIPGFVIQMIQAHLVATNKISRDMSVVLQFKHVLQVIGTVVLQLGMLPFSDFLCFSSQFWDFFAHKHIQLFLSLKWA